MQKLDGGIVEVNEWIDGAEKQMDDMDSQGPNDAALKVLSFIFLHTVFASPSLPVYVTFLCLIECYISVVFFELQRFLKHICLFNITRGFSQRDIWNVFLV